MASVEVANFTAVVFSFESILALTGKPDIAASPPATNALSTSSTAGGDSSLHILPSGYTTARRLVASVTLIPTFLPGATSNGLKRSARSNTPQPLKIVAIQKIRKYPLQFFIVYPKCARLILPNVKCTPVNVFWIAHKKVYNIQKFLCSPITCRVIVLLSTFLCQWFIHRLSASQVLGLAAWQPLQYPHWKALCKCFILPFGKRHSG